MVSNCPSSFSRGVQTGTAQATVTWTAPTAAGSTNQIASHSPPITLGLGDTPVLYQFINANNVRAECTFTISIVGKLLLYRCPKLSILLEKTQTALYFESHHTPPITIGLGDTQVSYQWQDANNVLAECTFTISIVGKLL